ncbi:MAG: phosphatidylglycerol lysyltransferase domain-containing protein, partial [Sciscionella sp.]
MTEQVGFGSVAVREHEQPQAPHRRRGVGHSVQPHRGSARPPRGRIRTPVEIPPWKRRAAGTVATLTQLGGVACLALLFDFSPHVPWRRVVDAVYTVFGLPVDSSLVVALLLFVLGVALHRRKRAALNLLIGFQVLTVLGLVSLFALRTAFGPDVLDFLAGRHVVLGNPAPEALKAALPLGVLIVQVLLRPAFPARVARGFIPRSIGILLAGLVVVSGIGWLLTEFFPGTLVMTVDRLGWAVNQATGRILILHPLGIDTHGPDWVSVLIGALSAVVVFLALVNFFGSVRTRRLLSSSDELRIRRLLGRFGEQDSLGYFATRRDRSVVFAADGNAAVTYRVLGGVSLAAGDPVGARESWHAAIKAWQGEAI